MLGSVQVYPAAVVVSVCLNPTQPSGGSPVSNQAARHPRVFKPSSSSLLFHTDICQSVQCGAPVLCGFSLVFGLNLYEL